MREQILDETERLLLETGSADVVSIRAVADAVGVTPPSIYRHFSDKDTLIVEVSERHFATLDAELEAAVFGLVDPIERLAACGKAYIRFGLANPEPYRILFMTRLAGMAEGRQQAWLAESTVFNQVVERAQACIDAGRFQPEHSDALKIALHLWAHVHGLTALAVSKPFLGLGTDEHINTYVDSALDSFARVAP